jgi:hypothetical protein
MLAPYSKLLLGAIRGNSANLSRVRMKYLTWFLPQAPHRLGRKRTSQAVRSLTLFVGLSILFLQLNNLDILLSFKRRLRDVKLNNLISNTACNVSNLALDCSSKRIEAGPLKTFNGRKPIVILMGETSGGTGNQIENIVEHISLVREHHFDGYVLPNMKPRKGLPIPGGDVWDLKSLRRILPRVYATIPKECNQSLGGKVDIYYNILRDKPGYLNRTIDSQSLASKTVTVSRGRETLGPPFDMRHEILELLSLRSENQKSRWKSRAAVCVRVGIHTVHPDWRLAPFLQLHEKYVSAARQWPLRKLGVVHLRWDEIWCSRDSEIQSKDGFICLRVSLPGKTHVWIPVKKYARFIHDQMLNHSIENMYFARSPYLPNQTWSLLHDSLRSFKTIKFAKHASEIYKGEDLNFIERQIAVASRLFIGESGSSWSFSVAKIRGKKGLTILSNDIFPGKEPHDDNI